MSQDYQSMTLRIKNFEDVDPISFELVKELKAVWYEETGTGECMAFDAWAWLRLICHNAKAKHPFTRKELGIQTRWKIYMACLSTPLEDGEPDEEQMRMLDRCASLHMTHRVDRDDRGLVVGIGFDVVSPVLGLKLEVEDWNLRTLRPRRVKAALHNHVGMVLHTLEYEVAENASDVTLIRR